MSGASEVTLTVNGLDFAGWKEVRISAGIERQARDFEVGITWRFPGGGERPRQIRQGDRGEIRIGSELVLTGYVFATPVSWDADRITTSIAGRSLTADLVDCSAINQPGQWRNQPVRRIVEALASPYGVTVTSELADGAALADHTIQPGETAFESIDRLLRVSQLLSTDDERGRLVIARPGSAGRAVDAIERGKNVLSGKVPLDFADVFSEYVSKGQRAGNDQVFGPAASEVEARVADTRIGRKRVLVLHESGQTTPALSRRRVAWERENRISKALKATYVVQGWRQSNGALWRHNQVVRVIDPLVGFDRDMLIVEIEYSLSEAAGTLTTLTVAPPDGYEAEPPEPGKKRRIKKGKGKDDFVYLLPEDWEKQ